MNFVVCGTWSGNSLRPLLHVSVSISVSAHPYPDKKWNKLKNFGSVSVVRISMHIRVSVRIRKRRPEKWLSEPFYPDADDLRTSFGKIRDKKRFTEGITDFGVRSSTYDQVK